MALEKVTLPMATAGTEYSLTLPSRVYGIIVRNPTRSAMRLAFATGVVTDDNADWVRIPPGTFFDTGQLELNSGTLYLSHPSISGVNARIEIRT